MNPAMQYWSVLHASPTAIEELAEKYVLNRLSAKDRERFEMHLLTCGRCRDAVATVEEFVQVFRSALIHHGGVTEMVA